MLEITIKTQPDDETCGPTCLQAVYKYFGEKITLSRIVKEVKRTTNGGTLASMLGQHALKKHYEATIYVYNLNIFDPSWFDTDGNAKVDLIQKLPLQLKYKKSQRMHEATQAYIDFLKLDGKIKFKDLSTNLLKQEFSAEVPIITGLSATYLYHCMREYYIGNHCLYDDIRGEPCGHFVVLCGYALKKKRVVVADPHQANPLSNDNYYKVGIQRLINAIMLGVLTYDANLLIIQPK